MNTVGMNNQEFDIEELTRVVGGAVDRDAVDPIRERMEKIMMNNKLTQSPYCPACGCRVTSFMGVYKCTQKGCVNEGKVLEIKNINWY